MEVQKQKYRFIPHRCKQNISHECGSHLMKDCVVRLAVTCFYDLSQSCLTQLSCLLSSDQSLLKWMNNKGRHTQTNHELELDLWQMLQGDKMLQDIKVKQKHNSVGVGHCWFEVLPVLLAHYEMIKFFNKRSHTDSSVLCFMNITVINLFKNSPCTDQYKYVGIIIAPNLRLWFHSWFTLPESVS